MRKIIVLEFVSLDGVIKAPGRPEEDTSGGLRAGDLGFDLRVLIPDRWVPPPLAFSRVGRRNVRVVEQRDIAVSLPTLAKRARVGHPSFQYGNRKNNSERVGHPPSMVRWKI